MPACWQRVLTGDWSQSSRRHNQCRRHDMHPSL
jgi:hypothetical protein